MLGRPYTTIVNSSRISCGRSLRLLPRLNTITTSSTRRLSALFTESPLSSNIGKPILTTKSQAGWISTRNLKAMKQRHHSSSRSSVDKEQDKNNDNSSTTSRHQNPNCIFCKILSNELEGSRVYEDDTCAILLDIHPIRPGHSLIIPKQHYANVMDEQMPLEVSMHMMRLAHLMTVALTTNGKTNDDTKDDFPCHGTNFMWNNGRAAWQTVPHAHLHVIPRQKGDSGAFFLGILKHILSLLGVPPANRNELNDLARKLNGIMTNHMKKQS